MTKTVAIVGAVNSALALLIAFGVDISSEQAAAIVAVVNALAVAVAAYFDPKVPWVGPAE